MEETNTYDKDLYYICNYRLRHKITNWVCAYCDCFDKIWIYPKEFKKRLREMELNEDIPYWQTNKTVRAYKTKYFINWKYE